MSIGRIADRRLELLLLSFIALLSLVLPGGLLMLWNGRCESTLKRIDRHASSPPDRNKGYRSRPVCRPFDRLYTLLQETRSPCRRSGPSSIFFPWQRGD